MRTMEWTCLLVAGLLCTGALQAAPGDNCASPIVVTLPAALPYADLGQHTCGRGDDYHEANTCIGDFNDSEDIIYELHVTATVDIEIVMDPKGQSFTAIALDEACPPSGALCLAFCGDTFDTPRTLPCLRLAPGIYTLTVDCWPVFETCIADFDLTIHACECAAGACCVEGTCVGTMTRPLCFAQAGKWYEGFACNAFSCPVEIATLPERCETAYPIAGLPFAAKFDTGAAMATADGPPGSCNDPNTLLMRRDVWFRYTPATDCTLKLDTTYDLYDGMTVVYAGPDSSQLTELHCLNSGPAAHPDRDAVAFPVMAGTTYWVQFGVRRGNIGGINLLALRCAETVLCGDADCDRSVGFGDINPFVLLLSNRVTWQAVFPGCPSLNGDINGDGTTDFADINPFVNLLSGGG